MIWVRLTTWKFPLLQLVAQFARPPLGFAEEAFTMAHLLGDPIDTINNLLQKLSSCQRRARIWKIIEPLVLENIQLEEERNEAEDVNAYPPEGLTPPINQPRIGFMLKPDVEREFLDQLRRDRWQKALGILTESYEEWGKGNEASKML